jgi:uncharacterized membrane protein YeaQ/YmgE (transglycosylase-associated protein family)
MDPLLTRLIVGLIAGVLASFILGGTGLGIIGDIIIGVCGAFVGGWLFHRFELRVPIGGISGTILVAFVGAVILLFIIKAVTRPGKL